MGTGNRGCVGPGKGIINSDLMVLTGWIHSERLLIPLFRISRMGIEGIWLESLRTGASHKPFHQKAKHLYRSLSISTARLILGVAR